MLLLVLQIQNGTQPLDQLLVRSDNNRELVFNALSLACGFAGNLFLLLHFTSRVRYIIALPFAILCWLLSAGIVSSFMLLSGSPLTSAARCHRIGHERLCASKATV
jgi:hypothetical protein